MLQVMNGYFLYTPKVEEQVVADVIIKKNQAIKLHADKKCIDSMGIHRDAGEEWLVRQPGAELYPKLSYHAMNLQNDECPNMPLHSVTAVTWGVIRLQRGKMKRLNCGISSTD